ncbi:MAG: hypothetical protein QOG64_1936 [Acidimicrobiaceae bacterium]|nr:hypothetical protein [Acidimicrobiaceae bacterium]
MVERGVLDELTAQVERLASARDWDGLIDLRDRCRRAVERGKQLWPVAAHVEYRLALEAPGPWAARMLEVDSGRFSFGPLPEVAASTHRWAELAPHVSPGPAATLAAHERVVRGEDLTDDAAARRLPEVLELPLVLQDWEPAYAVAGYHPDKADFPAPSLPEPAPIARRGDGGGGRPIDDPDAERALTELATAWVTESNGRAEAVTVEGSAADAVAALGVPDGRIRIAPVDLATALAAMAWTGASGGAHGRRRGAAAGRFAAWWAAAAMTDLVYDWPVPPTELGAAAAELRWFAWDAGEPDTGWTFRLAAEDPADSIAWAVTASDAA